MKRLIGLMTVLVVLLSFSVNAMAVGYVPSINVKPSPDVTVKDDGVIGTITTPSGEVVSNEKEECIIITPVAQAETSTLIPAEDKADLLKAYQQIKDAKKLSEVFKDLKDADKLVVRDLFAVSPGCDDSKAMEANGYRLNLTFDLKVKSDISVTGMLYADGVWKTVKLNNNGDGTVTVQLDKFGALAFLFPASAVGQTPDTGDAFNLTLWISLLAVSLILIVVLAFILRKRNSER